MLHHMLYHKTKLLRRFVQQLIIYIIYQLYVVNYRVAWLYYDSLPELKFIDSQTSKPCTNSISSCNFKGIESSNMPRLKRSACFNGLLIHEEVCTLQFSQYSTFCGKCLIAKILRSILVRLRDSFGRLLKGILRNHLHIIMQAYIQYVLGFSNSLLWLRQLSTVCHLSQDCNNSPSRRHTKLEISRFKFRSL